MWRQAQLADVVEERPELHLHQLRALESEPLSNDRGRRGDLERMAVGVAVGHGEGLHEGADLGLRITGGQLPVLVVTEGLPRERAELTEQLHLSRFELSLLVPATDTERPALLRADLHWRGGHRAESGGVRAPPDQVGVRAGSGHRHEPAPITGSAHHDPRRPEPEHSARVMGQAIENNARIPQPLGRRHPCR
jgi:hypothetical protein